MSDARKSALNSTANLIVLLALLVIVGIAQIVFATYELNKGTIGHSFGMILGMFINMAIIIYVTITVQRTRSSEKRKQSSH